MRHKKGAIELSVNFLVIIIVSSVILASGLVMFFKLKQGAVSYYDAVNDETQAKLRAMMLNTNYKVSLFPTDITLERKKSALVAVGVINTAGYGQNFGIKPDIEVKYFRTPESQASDVSNTWKSKSAIRINNDSGIPNQALFLKRNINPNGELYKSIYVSVPDKQPQGLYVIKLEILNTTCNPSQNPCTNIATYGIVKLYVNVP